MFLLTIFAILNLFIDLYYLIYSTWLIFRVKIKLMQKKTKPLLEEAILSGICFTSDVDMFLHMNNARYLRHCDYARFKVLAESGVYSSILALGGNALTSAHSVRYRKAMDLFTRYEIRSKIIYWDEKAFYVEQTFVDKNSGFVYCVVLTKQILLRVTTDKVLENMGNQVEKPTPLPELSKWIESMELSSARLKKAQ